MLHIEIVIKDLLEYLENYKILNISRSYKSQILNLRRKLPFKIFNEFFSKCKNENICYNFMNLYKQYLYEYEEYLYEKSCNK